MPSEILRWLAICGLGVPISHLLIPLVLGLLAPNYSSMRQYLSELTSIRSYAVIVNLLFSVAGLLTIAFSIALYHGIPRNVGWWITPVLLAVSGVSNVGAGIFPVNLKGFIAQAHTSISQVGSNVILVIPFLTWLTIRSDEYWRDLSAFTLVMQVVIAGTFALFVYVTETRDRPSSRSALGLCQRLFLGTYYGWFVALAIKLVLLFS